jgi:hypothetical protein
MSLGLLNGDDETNGKQEKRQREKTVQAKAKTK